MPVTTWAPSVAVVTPWFAAGLGWGKVVGALREAGEERDFDTVEHV